jgi:hypothetical protein
MVAQIDWRYFRARPIGAFGRLLGYAFFEGRPLTTRGRWFNSVARRVLAFSRMFPFRESAFRPVFIIGTGRSGTTVLGTILSLHREVAYLNEPKLLWHEAFHGEDVIGSYSATPGRLLLGADDATPEIADSLRRMYGAYLALTGTTRVIDKYPELVFRVDFVRALFPEAKFLLIVRNGFDACASIAEWSERHGIDHGGRTHDWWGVDDRKWRVLVDELGHRLSELSREQLLCIDDHMLRGAIEWTLTMQIAADVLSRHPEHAMLLRYEDLVSGPALELQRIFAFCGLAPDERTERYASEVLRPIAPKPRPDVAELVRPSLLRMMDFFGYRP